MGHRGANIINTARLEKWLKLISPFPVRSSPRMHPWSFAGSPTAMKGKL